VCIVRQNDNYDETVQREAEALVRAGFEVEVLCMRPRDGKPGTSVKDGVTITGLPASLHRDSLLSYCVDYGWFWLVVAGTLTARHLRRPYTVVQVNTMPDLLVFSAIGPKLLGSRVVAFLKEPTPELFSTLYGRPWLTRTLARIEQAAIRFADHALTVTDELRQVYIERGARAGDISVIRTGNAPPPSIEQGVSPARTEDGHGFLVLCHGTIEERYGLDTIVEWSAPDVEPGSARSSSTSTSSTSVRSCASRAGSRASGSTSCSHTRTSASSRRRRPPTRTS
jgi:hypothetical protein